MFARLRAAVGAYGKPQKPGKYTTRGPTGGGQRRGTIPGNGRPVVAWVYGPDVHAYRAASLGHYTNTVSPAARGVHAYPDASPSGFTGDPGYGVNRYAGKTQPVQNWYGLVAPLAAAQARSKRLGANAGVSGQPGLPSTGNDAGGLSGVSYAGYGGISTGWGS
jgi:hypothetical protein